MFTTSFQRNLFDVRWRSYFDVETTSFNDVVTTCCNQHSLVFVVFLHFFKVFCVFSLPIFQFCRVVQSNLYSAKTAANGFFKFIVLLCPFFFFSVCFSPFIFMVFSPALYNDLYVKTTLNLVTLVFQETGDKTKKTACIVVYIMHAQ